MQVCSLPLLPSLLPLAAELKPMSIADQQLSAIQNQISQLQAQSSVQFLQSQLLQQEKCSPSPCSSVQEENSDPIAEAIKTLNSRPNRSSREHKKLTLAEKLEIIRCHETKIFSQTRLAERYGKSRSAISKLLQPDNVRKLKELAGAGVTTKMKRCSSAHHPELERKVHEFFKTVGRNDPAWRFKLCMFAEKTAINLGISGFKANPGWCFRFLQRHGFVSSTETPEDCMTESLVKQEVESQTSTPDMGGEFSAFQTVRSIAPPNLINLNAGNAELPLLPSLSAILPLVLNMQRRIS
ncbi:hypothetical protein GUITHDRAFT_148592 [Guillardia theta CCMP2712]|uniref:HTH CENPB-type domain-containing protein n=1 Tax=Guillardia theta (strain CCMP2712) TaxID=905079 RepID=L1I8S1_GUITC|nr:hypothetical protein GUITHDRAFT_148592 [Guillardia theta CCMP2712]EKX32492.1 hypothetical protein GUITHDRAFT_148592 [Guillardia theta CCMP2712]|eukprot:XP_005819472.1 hypothetical protein GUITHDRAFT_148592 [Guillardia theta CCMP2712]